MAKKNAKLEKMKADLIDTTNKLDKAQGRVIRYANVMADLRAKRKRIQTAIVKHVNPAAAAAAIDGLNSLYGILK